MPPELSNQFLKAPPRIDKSKSQAKSKPLDPSFLRDLFEGIVDIPMGALGVGPDSKANRVGAMLGMALPTASKLGGLNKTKLGRYPEVDISSQIPTQNKLAMGVSPSSGIYDDVGRYLGPSAKVDEAYQAHVGSSVGKFKPGMKIQSMEDSFVNKGDTSGISPTREMINELMKKFRK